MDISIEDETENISEEQPAGINEHETLWAQGDASWRCRCLEWVHRLEDIRADLAKAEGGWRSGGERALGNQVLAKTRAVAEWLSGLGACAHR